MSVKYEEASLPITRLLLDPNNFRFQNADDFVRADDTRFAEATVQERTTKRIRGEGLVELKASIVSNGFLAVERLVVRPYKQDESGDWLYLVLEGNRRLAALQWIRADHEAGQTVPDDVLAVLDAVPVIVIESDDDRATYLAIMGIRHVGGIKQWGGYQRAKLVGDLRDRHGLDSGEIAERLGMTKHEVNRRYRALKALQQLEEDEDFADYASSSMYPIFHEAVSLPAVRGWLGWNDERAVFENREQLRDFYSLITPSRADDEDEIPEKDPKITSYSQVRDLREILANPEASKVLLDESRSFGDALGMAKAEELSSSWRVEIAEAVAALGSIGALELASATDEDLRSISALRDVSQRIIDTYSKLTA
ncbi:ParB N-terminal domain-containing protein [Microbacterium sp. No. 7]|uniref:ParB N-terminal domain-containing protein n=1 Tax=Microbacterium sp. No. 7 TaxID=1714373 RepID=UPI003008A729